MVLYILPEERNRHQLRSGWIATLSRAGTINLLREDTTHFPHLSEEMPYIVARLHRATIYGILPPLFLPKGEGGFPCRDCIH